MPSAGVYDVRLSSSPARIARTTAGGAPKSGCPTLSLMMRCPSASRIAACLLNSIARNGVTAWVRSASLIRCGKPRSWATSRGDATARREHSDAALRDARIDVGVAGTPGIAVVRALVAFKGLRADARCASHRPGQRGARECAQGVTAEEQFLSGGLSHGRDDATRRPS